MLGCCGKIPDNSILMHFGIELVSDDNMVCFKFIKDRMRGIGVSVGRKTAFPVAILNRPLHG